MLADDTADPADQFDGVELAPGDNLEVEAVPNRRAKRRSAAENRETAVSADSGRVRGQRVDTGGQVHFFTGREHR